MSPTAPESLYTCESFNLKVMSDDVKLLSIYGEHNGTMTNDDVMVFSNMFAKSKYLPNGIAKMFPNLERFNVASSGVKFIFRKNFVGFKKLRTLDLRFNEIEVLQDDVFVDLFDLEVLTISGNVIKVLPSMAFVSMMELRYFDASDNEITEFDDNIFPIAQKLEEVLLENNKIRTIRSNFGRFNRIGFIDLRDNECISAFYLRDQSESLSIKSFQKEVDRNCTKADTSVQLPASKRIERSSLHWDICPRLMLPTKILCLFERKFMKEVREE